MGRTRFPERQAQFWQLLRYIPALFLSYSILDQSAAIRRILRPPHGSGLIGDIDTLIAATALDRGLTVVTADSDLTWVPNPSVLLLDRQTLAPASRGTD